MTKTERQLLGELVKKLRASNDSAWEDLKDQIFDYGYQEYYPAQDYYRDLAPQMIAELAPDVKRMLIKEWRDVPRIVKLNSEEEIFKQWAAVVVDEIVTIAMAAQRR